MVLNVFEWNLNGGLWVLSIKDMATYIIDKWFLAAYSTRVYTNKSVVARNIWAITPPVIGGSYYPLKFTGDYDCLRPTIGTPIKQPVERKDSGFWTLLKWLYWGVQNRGTVCWAWQLIKPWWSSFPWANISHFFLCIVFIYKGLRGTWMVGKQQKQQKQQIFRRHNVRWLANVCDNPTLKHWLDWYYPFVSPFLLTRTASCADSMSSHFRY